MKKKIVAMCATVALAALAVGGTLAYFTDTEGAKNVMAVGNVDIVQDETDEGGDTFQGGQKLFPYTGTDAEASDTEYYDGNVMSTDQNWISKIVTVYNEEESEDAYVRTLFAFKLPVDAQGNVLEYPAADGGNLAWRAKHGLHYDIEVDGYSPTGSIYFPKNNGEYVIYTDTASGTKYMVGEYLYKMATDAGYDSLLKPGERSHPSLVSIALEKDVDNADVALYGNYEILVVSQAVQAEGWADGDGDGCVAYEALNTAFGNIAEVDNDKLAEWFTNVQ